MILKTKPSWACEVSPTPTSTPRSSDAFDLHLEGSPSIRSGIAAAKLKDVEVIFDGPVIKAASMKYLIESLSAESTLLDSRYVDVVLLAHSAFMPSAEFAHRLMEIYENRCDGVEIVGKASPQELTFKRARILSILKRWIQYDNISPADAQLYQVLQGCRDIVLRVDGTSWASQLDRALHIHVNEDGSDANQSRTGHMEEVTTDIELDHLGTIHELTCLLHAVHEQRLLRG